MNADSGDVPVPERATAGHDPAAAGEIEYDCSPWAGETRQVLRTLVAEAGVPHAWEGTVLVVPAAFEDAVDELVEGATSTARSSLDTARATVAYEVSPWSAGSQNRLVDLLVEAHVPHEWDSEGDLVVHAEDTELLESLIDELGEPDGGDEVDGLELHERLSALFVLVDRLCRDPHDSKARKGTRRAYAAVQPAAVPFGVEPSEWLALHREAAGLIVAIDADDPHGAADGDEPESPTDDLDTPSGGMEGHANALRDLLRRFV